MLQVRNKLHDDFIAVDGDGSNALDASELNVLFSKLGLAAPKEVRSFIFFSLSLF
jgi:Ca2+-binding EF-hand superfamily protein